MWNQIPRLRGAFLKIFNERHEHPDRVGSQADLVTAWDEYYFAMMELLEGMEKTEKYSFCTLEDRRLAKKLSNITEAPPIIRASMEALDLLSESTDLRDKLMASTEYFRAGMTERGFDIAPGVHPIVPIMLGDAKLAVAMADAQRSRLSPTRR